MYRRHVSKWHSLTVPPHGRNFGRSWGYIDRLVHHATIVEMNVESYRRKAALKRKRGNGD